MSRTFNSKCFSAKFVFPMTGLMVSQFCISDFRRFRKKLVVLAENKKKLQKTASSGGRNPLTASPNQSILRMSLSLSLSFSFPPTGGGGWRKNHWRALGGNLEAPWRSARGISAGNHSLPVRELSTEGLPPFTREGRSVARIVARVEQVLKSAILLRGCKLRLGRGWL